MTISKQNLNLNGLKKGEFEIAKKWWSYANCFNAAIVMLGLIASICPSFAFVSALLSTCLIVLYFFAQWISDNAKNTGEWALRQFEMWDGIGWTVDKKTLSDVLINVAKNVRETFDEDDSRQYFDSKKDASPKRLVENIMQSAFYSKHQLFFIAKIIFALSALILIASIFTAVIAIQIKSGGQNLSYLLLTAVQLVVSTGYLRMGINYWQFANDAKDVENRACALAGKQTVKDIDAIRLAIDYQIARSSSPLIPGWVWQYKQQILNELWEKHRLS